MKLKDKEQLKGDLNFTRIIAIAIEDHVVNLVFDESKAGTPDQKMAINIFYNLKGYSLESVSVLALTVVVMLVEVAFPGKDRETIANELQTGGEAETQLKAAIAANWAKFEIPTIAP
jgi:hypothetical protein